MKQTLTGFGMFHSRSYRSDRMVLLAPRRQMVWPELQAILQVPALNAWKCLLHWTPPPVPTIAMLGFQPQTGSSPT
jgi:hypothetical protein